VKIRGFSIPSLIPVLLLAVITVYFLLPYAFRAGYIEHRVANLTGTDMVSLLAVLQNDSIIIATTLLGVLAITYTKRLWVQLAVFAIIVLLHSLILLDVILVIEFSQRLNWADALKYGDSLFTYIADFQFKQLMIILSAGLAFLAVKALIFRHLALSQPNPVVGVPICVLILSLCALHITRPDTGYVHDRFYKNYVDYNRVIASERRSYSDAVTKRLDGAVFAETCTSGQKLDGPIIYYMVESLSAYHSELLGGFNDWTPKLDQMARENTYFENFFANGFTTEDGLISLLTEQYPLLPPDTYSKGGGAGFSGYWGLPETLPTLFNSAGYRTHFVTTADLNFSSTGNWARSIGFEHVEGAEQPFYDTFAKFHFDAAPDEALVERVLQIVDTPSSEPLFLFAKTVSSHHPHIDPVTGIRSEEQVIRYVDRQIDVLHTALQKRGFFENGHLIIVADHRAMTPLHPEEIAKWGFEESFARVPAVIIGDALLQMQGKIEAPYDQVDLANTVKGRISGTTCVSDVKSAITAETTDTPRYFFHRRGDQRNAVSVFSTQGYGAIVLNGDNTAMQNTTGIEPEVQSRLVDYVNWRRLQALRNMLLREGS
jgi:phosphoglycerol transferase MdoB-like AlkP superfamily enzyme